MHRVYANEEYTHIHTHLNAKLDGTVGLVVGVVQVSHAPLKGSKALAWLEDAEDLRVDALLVGGMACGLNGIDSVVCVGLGGDGHKVALWEKEEEEERRNINIDMDPLLEYNKNNIHPCTNEEHPPSTKGSTHKHTLTKSTRWAKFWSAVCFLARVTW